MSPLCIGLKDVSLKDVGLKDVSLKDVVVPEQGKHCTLGASYIDTQRCICHRLTLCQAQMLIDPCHKFAGKPKLATGCIYVTKKLH